MNEERGVLETQYVGKHGVVNLLFLPKVLKTEYGTCVGFNTVFGKWERFVP